MEKTVKDVKEKFWHNVECIAQCEFGVRDKQENVYKVFETWDNLFTNK
jgi:hypothetical protein